MVTYLPYNRSAHYTSVRALARQLFEPHYHEEIDSVLEEGIAATRVAAQDGKVLGFALCQPNMPMNMRGFGSNEENLEVAFLGVAPEAQGKGIGSGLLHCVKDLGYKHVWLQVAYTNPRAMQLYIQHGFNVWRTYVSHGGGYVLGWSAARLARLRSLRRSSIQVQDYSSVSMGVNKNSLPSSIL
jgi:ribosomal protein S18 acetylase RimI-like enzyme